MKKLSSHNILASAISLAIKFLRIFTFNKFKPV